jgi:hypothetical protein
MFLNPKKVSSVEEFRQAKNRTVDGCVHLRTLALRESTQDMVREVFSRCSTDPHPKAGKILSPQVSGERPEAVVPPIAPPRPEAQDPRRQGDVIDDDQEARGNF